jgi:hypothetical protein
MVNPKGSMHSRKTKPPGWGDFHRHWFKLLLVVIDVIHIERRVINETKNDAPVGPDGDSPKAFQAALGRMQSENRYIHFAEGVGRVEAGQNIAQLRSVFRSHASGVVVLVKALQPLVADILYRRTQGTSCQSFF